MEINCRDCSITEQMQPCEACPNRFVWKNKRKGQYSNAQDEANAIAGRSCEDSPASGRTRYL